MPRGLRVLMICGDDELATQLATALRGMGCVIDGARDADDALERLRQADAPQVAVVGDVAGSREPAETARRLRASFPDRQLMVLAVVRDATDLERATAAGADEVLRAPFAARELEVRLRGLRRALDLHRAAAGQSAHDPLTRLWNHAMVAEVLAHELARGERTQHPVSVLLIDVDGFAEVNSEHGHRVGDEVLGEVAQRVKVALRSYDLVGRFGGDEFLVVLPNCGRANAIEVAQRVRRGLAEAPVLLLKAKVELTLSVGISTTERGKKTTAADMIAAAETALDDAKRMGRDRVEVAGAVRGDRRAPDEAPTEKL